MTRYTVPHADPRRRSGVLTAEAAPESPARWSPVELLSAGSPRKPMIIPLAGDGRPVVSIIRGAPSDQ